MSSVGQQTVFNERALAGSEIVSIACSLSIAEWITFAFAGASKAIGAVPVILALALMVLSHRLRNDGLRDLGFRLGNFVSAFRLSNALLAAARLLGGVIWAAVCERVRQLFA